MSDGCSSNYPNTENSWEGLCLVLATPLSLNKCYDNHHANPSEHRQDLKDGLPWGGVLKQHGYDGDSCYVDEATRCEGEDPSRSSHTHTVGKEPAQGPSQGSDGCHQLEEDGLAFGVAGLDQDGKVSDLMR